MAVCFLRALTTHPGLAQAEDLYRQVLVARRGRLGAEHPLTLSSLDNLGTVLQGLGKGEEAVNTHREAMKGLKKILGAGHLVTLACMSNLAMALQSQDERLSSPISVSDILGACQKVFKCSNMFFGIFEK